MFIGETPRVGTPALDNRFLTIDATPQFDPGETLFMVDDYWGAAEFIYVKFVSTVRQFGLCTYLAVFGNSQLELTADEVPNSANLGRPLGIATSAAVSGHYGWLQISGTCPVANSASVAASSPFGIAAAGRVGANSAGKQVLNAVNSLPATTTVAKTGCTGRSGDTQINVNDSRGWFVGCVLSGTGVGASALITDISKDGKVVTVSVANSAAINGTVTATYTGFNVITFQHPFAQGAIT